MVDPTKQYEKIVGDADARFDSIRDQAEDLFPTHSRKARKLSREEQKQDYLRARSTPGGMQVRLREWRQQFGLKRAAQMFIEWDKQFRD